jgi:cytochrome c
LKLSTSLLFLGVAAAASLGLALIHPWGDLRSAQPQAILQGAEITPEARQVIEAKCVDCHSTNTRWPLYSRLAPGSWLIERDIAEGRSHLNLSAWQQYSAEDQMSLLSKIASEARSGEMPPRQYLIIHRDAKLTPEQEDLLYAWAKAERKRLKTLQPEQAPKADLK